MRLEGIPFKYIISDIHGCYDAFTALLDKVQFSDADELLVLGDAVDRGPESIKVLQHIMAAGNMEMLLGNHEDMMLKVVAEENQNLMDYITWMHNGGAITHMHFMALPEDEQKKVVSFLKELPLYLFQEGYLFVHAGLRIPRDQSNLEDCLERTLREDFVWIREAFMNNPNRIKGYKVIFGHTPTTFLGLPEAKFWLNEREDKLCIDCGKVYGGRLGILRLDDMAEFYL